ncbi:hypothetical protein J6590_008980 [Homalodisca vitripennis]|nr:hypothetical protein J6590_008980 [Homalodisca vitripennis]
MLSEEFKSIQLHSDWLFLNTQTNDHDNTFTVAHHMDRRVWTSTDSSDHFRSSWSSRAIPLSGELDMLPATGHSGHRTTARQHRLTHRSTLWRKLLCSPPRSRQRFTFYRTDEACDCDCGWRLYTEGSRMERLRYRSRATFHTFRPRYGLFYKKHIPD